MRTRLFDVDSDLGMVQLWHSNRDGEVTIETRYDVEPVVDLAKAEYNSTDERARWKDLQRVARIPMPLVFQLQEKGIGPRDQKAFKKWLNDPDNRVFRTRPGLI